jgi:hypothetical protein
MNIVYCKEKSKYALEEGCLSDESRGTGSNLRSASPAIDTSP